MDSSSEIRLHTSLLLIWQAFWQQDLHRFILGSAALSLKTQKNFYPIFLQQLRLWAFAQSSRGDGATYRVEKTPKSYTWEIAPTNGCSNMFLQLYIMAEPEPQRADY